MGTEEPLVNPSDVCENGLESVQVSKKWNLEFPHNAYTIPPSRCRRDWPEGRFNRSILSDMRKQVASAMGLATGH